MEIGQEGTINWSDGTTSRVILVDIEYNSYTQNDYWLEYKDSEKHRPLVHPDLGNKEIIKSSIVLPSGLFHRFFKKDVDTNSFEYKLDQYIKANFDESTWMEANSIFNSLINKMGKQYVIDKYLNKK